MLWNRQAIVDQIKGQFLGEYPDLTIGLGQEPGGSYDLLCVDIGLEDGEHFTLTPFTDPAKGGVDGIDFDKLDNMDVYAIEMTDGADSRGGYNGKSTRAGQLFGGMKTFLRNLGFYTIDNYHEIF